MGAPALNLDSDRAGETQTRPRLRRPVVRLFAAGILLACAGCMESDVGVAVRRDASGEVRIRVLVRDDARDRAAQLAWLADRLNLSEDLPIVALLRMIHDAGGDPLHAIYRRDVLEAWARDLGPEVRLQQTRRLHRHPDANGFEAVYAFPDIRRVGWTGDPGRGETPDRIAFAFMPAPQPVLRVECRPGRAPVEDVRESRAMDLMARIGLRSGLGRAAAHALEGLHLRVSVGAADAELWTPEAVRRMGPSSVMLTEIRAADMDGEDLLRLLRIQDLADLEHLSRRPTPGIHLQDPRRALPLRLTPAR